MTRAGLTINRVLMIAALAILLFSFTVYVVYAANLIRFPFDYDQGEGFELVDTIMFSQGKFPYQDTNIYPFYSSNYPPLFHVIAAPFVWFFGDAYWYGRLLGFLGTLVTAAAIAYAVYRDGGKNGERGSPLIAILSGLAFLAANTVYHIGPLFRQHMSMVMFETLAVVVLAHANEIEDARRRRWTIFLGLALVMAAGYTKQLAFATAIAVFAFMFIRQPRRAVIWGIGFGVIGGAIFLWMNLATHGQWWLQTITANVNEYIPDQTIGLFRLWFSLYGFLLVPAALYAIYELYFSRLSIYTIWFAAAVGVAFLSGKWGAGDSYFATSIAALCLLSGLFASRTLKRGWTFPRNYLSRIFIFPFRRLAPALGTLGLVVIPLLYIGYGRATLHMPTTGAVFEQIAATLHIQANAQNGFYDSAGRIAGGYADIGHLTTQADIDAGWKIVDMVKATDKPVLSEDAAFDLLAGKQVIGNPTQLLNLALDGKFDSSALIQMVNDRDFGLIIFRAQFYPMDVLQAIARNYQQSDEVDMNGFHYLILRPKS